MRGRGLWACGNKIRNWTALRQVINPSKNGAMWLCRCDCGVERVIRAVRLSLEGPYCIKCQPHPKLHRIKPEYRPSGQYGDWCVSGEYRNRVRKGKSKGREWMVTCTRCHTVKWKTNAELASKNHCMLCNRGQHHQQYGGYKFISGKRWYQIISGAKSRNLSVNISIESAADLLETQNFECALTGLRLDITSTASLDRIDSRQGYIHGNIQWVHKDVNLSKWDLTQERYIELSCLVATRAAKAPSSK